MKEQNIKLVNDILKALSDGEYYESKYKDRIARDAIMQQAAVSPMVQQAQTEQIKDDERVLFLAMRKCYFKENIKSYWRDEVKYSVSDEGAITFESFEKWRNRVEWKVPDFMSKTRVLEYFDKEISELYQEKLEEAKEEAESKDEE